MRKYRPTGKLNLVSPSVQQEIVSHGTFISEWEYYCLFSIWLTWKSLFYIPLIFLNGRKLSLDLLSAHKNTLDFEPFYFLGERKF